MEDTYKGQVDNPLTLNRYTYVHNNPLRFIDPSGNHSVEHYGGGGGGGNVRFPSITNPKRVEVEYKPRTVKLSSSETDTLRYKAMQKYYERQQVNTRGMEKPASVINNGRATIEAAKANPNQFNGKSVDEVAKMLKAQGYDVNIEASTKSRSGAMIIKISNTGGERNITQVQVSPGGGRHGESPYIKISTSDQGTIKIVNGRSEIYKSQGPEKNTTIIFTER
ncbi:hypothetical protein P4V64_30025 [Bacillus thuringiensis]|nr:hypothetical protein [Bacillus thuringiensis]